MTNETQTSPMIYKAMNDILSDIEAIAKSRRNDQQGYAFRGIDDFFMAVHPLLKKHRVFVMPHYEVLAEWERQTKHGSVLGFVRLKGTFHFCADDGSSVVAEAIGEGMDSGDKATYKAQSGTYKYVLMQAFCVPTGEAIDAETDSPERPPARPDGSKPQGQRGRQYRQENNPRTRNAAPSADGKQSLASQKMKLVGAVAKALNIKPHGDGAAEINRLIKQAADSLGADPNTEDGRDKIHKHFTEEIPEAKRDLLKDVMQDLQCDKEQASEAIRECARKNALDTNELHGIQTIRMELCSDADNPF
jgi:hypothetical protein